MPLSSEPSSEPTTDRRESSECEIGCRRYQKKLSVVFQPVRTIDRGVGGGEMMTGGRGPIIGLHAPLRASCDASLSLLHLASERAHVRIALKSAAFAPRQLSHRSSVPAGRWLQLPILTRALAASCFASPASKCMAHTYKHAIASCVTWPVHLPDAVSIHEEADFRLCRFPDAWQADWNGRAGMAPRASRCPRLVHVLRR